MEVLEVDRLLIFTKTLNDKFIVMSNNLPTIELGINDVKTIIDCLSNKSSKEISKDYLFDLCLSLKKPRIKKTYEKREGRFCLSYDYINRTNDYKFLDYKVSGQNIDAKTMVSYIDQEPDLERFKKYKTKVRSYLLPEFEKSKEYFIKEEYKKYNEAFFIKNLFSFCFGVSKKVKVDSVERREKIIRKISPSGGSRHPTEHYLIKNEKGDNCYHYCFGENKFDKIIGDHYEMGEGIKYSIILTSMPSRNRYRYREIRTFRTLFLDVGHVVGNLEMILNEVGLKYQSYPLVCKDELSKKLKLNIENEFLMYRLDVY